MSREEALTIFRQNFGCEPEQFRGVNEPYFFPRQDLEISMRALGICSSCCGSGTSWAECCNGSRGCPCNGTAVSFMCNVCQGTGRINGSETGNENLEYIHRRAVANKGYFF